MVDMRSEVPPKCMHDATHVTARGMLYGVYMQHMVLQLKACA